MALVLCTGSDEPLMKTRQLILERAGHTVVTAMDQRLLEGACQNDQFDVAVIGQDTVPQEKLRIASVIRQHCPTAKILELHAVSPGKVIKDADSWLEVLTSGPNELAERVATLARSVEEDASKLDDNPSPL